MDTRTTSADFYPGGKTPVTAGGGITSGETGGAAGEPMVPVTKVEGLPEHYRESDMRSKINELARVISGGVAAIIAMVSLTLGAEPVKVLGVKKDALWNDDFVVTNVVADFAGFATTNTVTGATNALAATFQRGLEVATNAVVKAGAKEIAAATNALSQSVDERLKASTNGSFSAAALEPYAKRTWVEAQGYLKSTNLTGYAQVNWVQNQGYIKREEAAGEISRVVNEKIAAQDETAAYRLMSADGYQWIDGTGVCWRVESNVEVNGTRMKGYADDTSWDGEGVNGCSITEDQEGMFIWEYAFVSIGAYEDGQEWQTYHRYEAVTNISTGTVQLRILEDDNYQTAGGYLPAETLDMRHWTETNIVNRVVFTTNDVAGVAEVESAVYSPWLLAECTDRHLRYYLQRHFADNGYPDVKFANGVWKFAGTPEELEEYTWTLNRSEVSGAENATNIVVTGMYLRDGEDLVDVTFSRGVKVLAKVGEPYVTPTYAEMVRQKTDNVAHRNTLEESQGWWSTGIADIRCEDEHIRDILIGMARDDEIYVEWDKEELCWKFIGLPTIGDYGHSLFYDEVNDREFEVLFGDEDDDVLLFRGLYTSGDKGIDVEVVRAVKAVAKAGEPYVTKNYVKETVAEVIEAVPAIVTNVARDVSNSFWDEKNEVLWRMEFRDGEPMFVPVTNENVKATGGVL